MSAKTGVNVPLSLHTHCAVHEQPVEAGQAHWETNLGLVLYWRWSYSEVQMTTAIQCFLEHRHDLVDLVNLLATANALSFFGDMREK